MRGLVLIAFGLLILYGFSNSFTGYAISQTCCTGPICAPENACEGETEPLPMPSGAEPLGFFVVATLTAIAAVSWVERKEKR